MGEEIPQWALERAAERVMAEPGKGGRYDAAGIAAYDAGRAFARYIAEHEEPPVDPMITEAAGLIQNWRDGGAGEDDAHDTARLVLAALRRGMELAREQSK